MMYDFFARDCLMGRWLNAAVHSLWRDFDFDVTTGEMGR